MNNEIKVKKDSQDRNTEAWKQLLNLIDLAVADERIEFHPRKVLGEEVWKQIRSLPKAIYRLKKIKHLMLYGSHLERFPQEIGQMDGLEVFTP